MCVRAVAAAEVGLVEGRHLSTTARLIADCAALDAGRGDLVCAAAIPSRSPPLRLPSGVCESFHQRVRKKGPRRACAGKAPPPNSGSSFSQWGLLTFASRRSF